MPAPFPVGGASSTFSSRRRGRRRRTNRTQCGTGWYEPDAGQTQEKAHPLRARRGPSGTNPRNTVAAPVGELHPCTGVDIGS